MSEEITPTGRIVPGIKFLDKNIEILIIKRPSKRRKNTIFSLLRENIILAIWGIISPINPIIPDKLTEIEVEKATIINPNTYRLFVSTPTVNAISSPDW